MKYDKSKRHDCSSAKRAGQKKKERRNRVVRRLAIIIIGFAVLSITATEVMMFILFERSEPVLASHFTIFDKIDGKASKSREIYFLSGDNVLKGYVILPPSPLALILLVHGVRGSSDIFEPIEEYLLDHSYAVMAFDGTACGRSPGKKAVGLRQQCYDTRAALEYIAKEPELSSLPLVLFGHSAGAYGVAAAAPASGAVACVCVSGFETPLGTMRFWAEKYAGVLADVEYPFLYLREYAANGNDANESASNALERSQIPALVIHSRRDKVIPLGISLYQSVTDKSIGTVKAVSITDERFGGHSDVFYSNGTLNTDLLDIISGFIDENLSIN